MPAPLRKILLAGASVFGALAAAEVGLRLARYGERLPVLDIDANAADAIADGTFVESRDLFWRLPGCDAYCRSIRHAHPDNPDLQPDPQALRVLCLGDSCTYFGDAGVPPYSVLLERSFRGPRTVRVINAGVPGYTSYQGKVWLESELLAAEPDLVTVYFGWNDCWRAHSVPDEEYARSLELSPLRLLRLFGRSTGRSGTNERDRRRVPLDDYAANLEEIRRLVASAGARCVFVTGPGRFVQQFQDFRVQRGFLAPGEDAMAIHRRYMDVVRGMADAGATVLDLDAVFEARPDEVELLRVDGIHLSGKGLVLATQLLREHIAEHGLLR